MPKELLAKIIIGTGILLILVGGLFLLASKIPWIGKPRWNFAQEIKPRVKKLKAFEFIIHKFPHLAFLRGKLPGDVYINKKNFTLYFPLTTCILISLFLSILFYLLFKR